MAKTRYRIDGVVIPTPTKLAFGIEDLSSDETGRSLDGVMHKDVVAVKDYYSAEWKTLSEADAQLLLRLTDGKQAVSFYFKDPRGVWGTGTFYVGKREGEIRDLSDERRMFSNIKMQFTRV